MAEGDCYEHRLRATNGAMRLTAPRGVSNRAKSPQVGSMGRNDRGDEHTGL